MKILLAYTSGATGTDENSLFMDLLPVGLCSIHAVLRSRGFDAELANLSGTSQKELDALLLKLRPGILGLSQWTHNRHETLKIARRAKKLLPGCLLVLGGAHATAQAELILRNHPEVDIIVSGEGETTFLELVQAIENGGILTDIPGLVLHSGDEILGTAIRDRIRNLDALPFPYSFLDEATGADHLLQAQFIASSRGCPSDCRFCGSPSFWGRRVATRSPESVIEELIFLRNRFGLMYISFRDETFTMDRERILRLCRLLTSSRLGFFWNCQTRAETLDIEMLACMKRAGCECIQLGVESGSPKTLKHLGKKSDPEIISTAAEMVHCVGLSLSIYLISGISGETDNDIALTCNLVKRIRPHDIQIAPLALYPGTAICSESIKGGLIDRELFEKSVDPALLAMPESNSSEKLHNRLRYCPPLFDSKRVAAIQERYGYTAVGCMQLGDFMLEAGRPEAARKAFSMITREEPEHPWGWQLLAEMYENEGNVKAATCCYTRLLKLVPAHAGAKNFLSSLKECKRRR